MSYAKEFITNLFVEEKKNALRVLEVLKDYPSPRVFIPMVFSAEGMVPYIELFWDAYLSVKFIESTIQCTLYPCEGHYMEINSMEPEDLLDVMKRLESDALPS